MLGQWLSGFAAGPRMFAQGVCRRGVDEAEILIKVIGMNAFGVVVERLE